MKAFHLCPTPYCRRRKRKKGSICSRCSMRAWRAANPVKNWLADLRKRAKKKKLDFDLTLEWFQQFVLERGYDPKFHHIDRISSGRGYVMGNLQVLSQSENIAKGNRERHGQLQIL